MLVEEWLSLGELALSCVSAGASSGQSDPLILGPFHFLTFALATQAKLYTNATPACDFSSFF